MNASRLLRRMCVRHGLPLQDAQALLPLVKRALFSPARLRDRMLALVDANLARRAGHSETSTEALARDLDEEVLISVGRVLHTWSPSGKVIELGGALGEFFPDGFDLGDITG